MTGRGRNRRRKPNATAAFGTKPAAPIFGRVKQPAPTAEELAAEHERLTTVYNPHAPPPDDDTTADGVRLGVVADVDARLGRHQSMRLGRYITSWKNKTPFPSEPVDVDELFPAEKQWLDIDFRKGSVPRRACTKLAPGRGCTDRYWASRFPAGRGGVLHGRVARTIRQSPPARATEGDGNEDPTPPKRPSKEPVRARRATRADLPTSTNDFWTKTPESSQTQPSKTHQPEETKTAETESNGVKTQDPAVLSRLVKDLFLSEKVDSASISAEQRESFTKSVAQWKRSFPQVQRFSGLNDAPRNNLRKHLQDKGLLPKSLPGGKEQKDGTNSPVPLTNEAEIMRIFDDAQINLLDVRPSWLTWLNGQLTVLHKNQQKITADYRRQMVNAAIGAAAGYDPEQPDAPRGEDLNLREIFNASGLTVGQLHQGAFEHVKRALRDGRLSRTLSPAMFQNLVNYLKSKSGSPCQFWGWRFDGYHSSLCLYDTADANDYAVFVRLPTDDEIDRIRLEPGVKLRAGDDIELVQHRDAATGRAIFVPYNFQDENGTSSAIPIYNWTEWDDVVPDENPDDPDTPILRPENPTMWDGDDDELAIDDLCWRAGVPQSSVNFTILRQVWTAMKGDRRLFKILCNPFGWGLTALETCEDGVAVVMIRNIVALIKGNYKLATAEDQNALIWVRQEAQDRAIVRVPANRALVSPQGELFSLPTYEEVADIRVQDGWSTATDRIYSEYREGPPANGRVFVDQFSSHFYFLEDDPAERGPAPDEHASIRPGWSLPSRVFVSDPAAHVAGLGRTWIIIFGKPNSANRIYSASFEVGKGHFQLTDRQAADILIQEGDELPEWLSDNHQAAFYWQEVMNPANKDRLYVRKDRVKGYTHKGWTEVDGTEAPALSYKLRIPATETTPQRDVWIPSDLVGTSPEHGHAKIIGSDPFGHHEVDGALSAVEPDSARLVDVLRPDGTEIACPDNKLTDPAKILTFDGFGATVKSGTVAMLPEFLGMGERFLTASADNGISLTAEQVRAGGGICLADTTKPLPPAESTMTGQLTVANRSPLAKLKDFVRPGTGAPDKELRMKQAVAQLLSGVNEAQQGFSKKAGQDKGLSDLHSARIGDLMVTAMGLAQDMRPDMKADPVQKAALRTELKKEALGVLRTPGQDVLFLAVLKSILENRSQPQSDNPSPYKPLTMANDAETDADYPEGNDFIAPEFLNPAFEKLPNGRPTEPDWHRPPPPTREQLIEQRVMQREKRRYDALLAAAQADAHHQGQRARAESARAAAKGKKGIEATSQTPGGEFVVSGEATVQSTAPKKPSATTRVAKAKRAATARAAVAGKRNVSFGPLPTEEELGRRPGSGLMRTRSGLLYGAQRGAVVADADEEDEDMDESE